MNRKSKQAKLQEVASRLQLARLQQMRAESNLENAKERARLAKRRRKEAKQAFRRARKEVKRAKIELAKTEELITETEAKLAEAKKFQAKKQPEAKTRPKARAKPSALRGKAATPPKRTRAEGKDQPPPIAPTAEFVPAKVLAPEPGKREASPSVPHTN